MKIAVNGMYLTDNATGIANVVINVVNNLAKYYEITVFANKQVLPEIKNRMVQSIDFVENTNRFFFRKPIWFFLKLPKLISYKDFDFLWSPAVWTPLGFKKKIKIIVTVHDFVSKEYKNTMRFFNRIITDMIENHSINNADYLWCVSNYTKEHLIKYFPKRKCKDIFVGSAPDSNIKKVNNIEKLKEITSELKLPQNYMLFVGSLEPRKNLKFLLQVFREYSKKNKALNLVIVGAKGWGKTEISDIINSPEYPKERVLFTGFVSDEQLIAIYNLSSIYISTSLNEGFGLPQVEAMNCGIPVISPDNSAMKEIVEGAGVVVSSWNLDDWCDAIEYSINNKNTIIEKQNIRRKLYNWDYIIQNFISYIGGDNSL